ncbi:MAG: sugar transferase, partial [Actinobacteria bacterium]|nr:sugar transferase [Actinomycetota bacterium]
MIAGTASSAYHHVGFPAPVAVPAALPPLGRLFKRVVDIVIATVALVATLPILVLAAVAIMVESPGGAFFVQTRVGLGGRPFRIVKLRSMRLGSDDDDEEHRAYVAAIIRGEGERQEGIYKIVGDDRRTRIGRWLRNLSIDELPQLWNVLRGEMSVVGPRPPLPEEAALYDQAAWARMATKPGLTGLWQVSGRSRLSFEEMIELDVRYWQEWSPLLDVRILLRTP